MILNGAMTVSGFRYMLMTHGLASFVKVVGCTVSDEEIPERGDQISAFLNTAEWPPYVVLDDGAEEPQSGATLTMSASLTQRHFWRWVKIDGNVGLADRDVERAREVLLRDGDVSQAASLLTPSNPTPNPTEG